MKKVAIFDIDGTIFRSSLLIELVEAMISQGIMPSALKKSYAREYKSWLDRRGSYDDYINAVVKNFNARIKGVEHKKFMAVGRQVIDFHQNRVYRYTRDLIKDLKKRKYFLLAISHSPMEIVQKFAFGLGFDKVYGLIYEVGKNGKFTGRHLHESLILDKGKVLARAVEKENLTLRGSVGVGDTESDIKFLKMVTRPICFNPNRKLYDYARRRKWEIVVERKDVIYHM